MKPSLILLSLAACAFRAGTRFFVSAEENHDQKTIRDLNLQCLRAFDKKDDQT